MQEDTLTPEEQQNISNFNVYFNLKANNLKYNFLINIDNKFLRYFYSIFYGPILLGYLSNKANNFFYIWSRGFLLNRNFDFKIL